MSRGAKRCRVSLFGARIERARLKGCCFVGLLARQVAREDIVSDRENSTVPIRAQAEALDRIRAVCRDMKYLLSCQRGFHWPHELARRNRRQNGIGIDPELAAESAADEGTDKSHVLNGNFQGPRDSLLSLAQHLVRGVEDELVALPHRERGMGFHHRVTLQGRGVSHVELHRSRSEGAREITHRTIGRHRDSLWNADAIQIIPEHVLSGQPIIFHAHQVRGCPGLLEGFRDHEGDRLAVTRHLRTGEHRMGLMVIACALRGRISVREDQNNSGRFFRRPCIDRFDLALADRGFDHIAVCRVRSLQHLIRINRPAGDLQPPVHTVKRLAENTLRSDVERIAFRSVCSFPLG